MMMMMVMVMMTLMMRVLMLPAFVDSPDTAMQDPSDTDTDTEL